MVHVRYCTYREGCPFCLITIVQRKMSPRHCGPARLERGIRANEYWRRAQNLWLKGSALCTYTVFFCHAYLSDMHGLDRNSSIHTHTHTYVYGMARRTEPYTCYPAKWIRNALTTNRRNCLALRHQMIGRCNKSSFECGTFSILLLFNDNHHNNESLTTLSRFVLRV